MTHEAELAKQVIHLLDAGAREVSPEVSSRLAAARKAAVEQVSGQARGAQVEPLLAGGSRLLTEHWRHPSPAVTATLVLAVLVLVVLLLHQHQQHNAPMEADALLLGSELPPEAYVDQGFDTWLKHSSQP